MNLFKVIASGKKTFQEETASAVLAWLLNPTMEHGLGFEFLSRFLTEIQEATGSRELTSVINTLSPRLRTESDEQAPTFWCSLEMAVQGAFIDVVFGVEDWIFAIENKIYSTSATEHQLVREYLGLKKKFSDKKIAMVYLVPCDGIDSPLHSKIETVFDELEPETGDCKVLMTWQENSLNHAPSVTSIIRNILEEESRGNIEPVPEYCRHTLKSLLSFIRNDFAGYDYERASSRSGKNPLMDGLFTIQQLKNKEAGYVGVAGGIRGLIRIGREVIVQRKFQYGNANALEGALNWLPLNTFLKVVTWLTDDEKPALAWDGKFPSDMIYTIAGDYDIVVGIRGGDSALRTMSTETIENKEWRISSTIDDKSKQWIEGKLFCEIVDGKRGMK